MNLSPEQRKQLRLSLLRFLDNNASARGMSAALLLQMARSEGRPGLDAAGVEAELQYLADRKLIAPVTQVLSPEVSIYRITADGRDFFASNEQ